MAKVLLLPARLLHKEHPDLEWGMCSRALRKQINLLKEMRVTPLPVRRASTGLSAHLNPDMGIYRNIEKYIPMQ